MNLFQRTFIIVFFLGLSTLSILAQNVSFQHINTNNGLSHFSVNSIYIDEFEAIWIGTREGLNKYNGNSIETFKNEKDNPNSLKSNLILKVTGNRSGDVFILTPSGVSRYNIEQEEFTLLKEGDVDALFYQNGLYIAIKDKIFFFDSLSNKWELIRELPNPKATIKTLYVDASNTIWVGTELFGLFSFTTEGAVENVLAGTTIINIYEDSQNTLWLSSRKSGLFAIDYNSREIINYTVSSSDISSNFVRDCCEDNLGNLWIGTFKGLDRFSLSDQKFDLHLEKNSNNASMSHSSVWSIEKDHQGSLWIGTYFGGVNFFNPEYEVYTTYQVSSIEKQGLSSPVIGRILEDKNENLWICTEGGGINVYNRSTNQFKWYTHKKGDVNSLSQNNVKSIYYNEELNIMWIGTHMGGLNKLDLNTDRITHYRMEPNIKNSFPSDIIRDIVPYQNNLIVATNNGVFEFSPKTGVASQLFKNLPKSHLIQVVSDLEFDQYGRLWMAVSGQGLFRYSFGNQELVQFKNDPTDTSSLSCKNINSISKDKYNRLWFATSGSGIDLYDPKNNSFINIDLEKIGQVSNCVYKIHVVNQSELIATTNQGFIRLNLETKAISSYNYMNGFPLTAVNENSLFMSSDKRVFLGGVDGMISFKLSDLDVGFKPFSLSFSKLIINGEEVKVGDSSGVLKQSFVYTNHITLKPSQQTVDIQFSTSNYIPANQSDVVYQLKGFSSTWNNTNFQNTITYTNLSPGNYTLNIKECNSDNESEVLSLDIEVLPPIYKTVWAYLLYAVLFCLLYFYLFRLYRSRVLLSESLKYERQRAKDIEKLNELKLRSFTNISHEFRTPLTLIIGQIESIIGTPNINPTLYNKVLYAYKSCIQLKDLIGEFLDFRKQEQGMLNIKVSEYNLVEFMYENFLLFTPYAEEKNIHISFESTVKELYVWFDQRQLQKAINNLIFNAIKHTAEGESIVISIENSKYQAMIHIKDSGVGIKKEELSQIFNRFFQAEDPNVWLSQGGTGTGIGLALTKGIINLHKGKIDVESIYGKGSIFTIYLRLGNTHFESSQIRKNKSVVQELVLEEIKEDLSYTPPSQENRFKILIVEDNKPIRDLLISIFEELYEVYSAEDGEQALRCLREITPDIILSDVLMPNMSGIELCKQIKSNFDYCHIPVVLLTARTAVEHKLEGLQIGADDYITKPFDSRVLISRCNNLINSRLLLQEKFSKEPSMDVEALAINPLDKKLLDDMIEVINVNLDNCEFTVDQLAAEVGVSRTNLYNKLRGITGKTPNEFIISTRLKKGAYLLKNHLELNVTEISELIGFSSPRYFSKCFKDNYNITPLKYRNNNK